MGRLRATRVKRSERCRSTVLSRHYGFTVHEKLCVGRRTFLRVERVAQSVAMRR